MQKNGQLVAAFFSCRAPDYYSRIVSVLLLTVTMSGMLNA